jgi:hypothetical protein
VQLNIKPEAMKLVLAISIFIMAISELSAQIDCSRVKTGKFSYEDKETGTTIIIRKGNIQREENSKMGIITEDTMVWISDCMFRLVPGKVVLNKSKLDLSKDMQLEVHIVEVNKTFYKARIISRLSGQSMNEEVKILN